MLDDLQNSNNVPDVLCLTETFLRAGHESSFKLNDYDMAASFSRENKRGGVCILVRKGLEYKNKSMIKHSIVRVFECCAIEIPSSNLIIICVYRTPTSDVLAFLNSLDAVLYEVNRKRRKKVVILGDFNINILKVDKITTHLRDLTKNYNLIIHINLPTRRSSCIDQILSNIENATASILTLGMSDHETAQMISFPINNKIIKRDVNYMYKRNYSNENISIFKKSISKLSFNEVYMEKDPEIAFNKFHDILLTFYNLCFPKIKIKIRKPFNDKGWITKGLKKSSRTKRLLRIKYYTNKDITAKNHYLQYSKLLKKCIYQAQKKTNSSFISNSKNKCKASWQVIKNQEYSASKDSLDEIRYQNKTISDPLNITTAFNSYFTDLSQHTVQNKNNLMYDSQRDANKTGRSMYLTPVNEYEVKKIVLSLKNTNSEGPDEICTKVIKSCVNELASILTFLVNISFESGEYPQKLKLSIKKKR